MRFQSKLILLLVLSFSANSHADGICATGYDLRAKITGERIFDPAYTILYWAEHGHAALKNTETQAPKFISEFMKRGAIYGNDQSRYQDYGSIKKADFPTNYKAGHDLFDYIHGKKKHGFPADIPVYPTREQIAAAEKVLGCRYAPPSAEGLRELNTKNPYFCMDAKDIKPLILDAGYKFTFKKDNTSFAQSILLWKELGLNAQNSRLHNSFRIALFYAYKDGRPYFNLPKNKSLAKKIDKGNKKSFGKKAYDFNKILPVEPPYKLLAQAEAYLDCTYNPEAYAKQEKGAREKRTNEINRLASTEFVAKFLANSPEAQACQFEYERVFKYKYATDSGNLTTPQELIWMRSWLNQRSEGQLCDPLPATMGENFAAAMAGQIAFQTDYSFNGVGIPDFPFRDEVPINRTNPSTSDCLTTLNAVTFGIDTYTAQNFTAEHMAWRTAALSDIETTGSCPAIPSELVTLATNYAKRFGYSFNPSSQTMTFEKCDAEVAMIRHYKLGGDVRRWADSYQFYKRRGTSHGMLCANFSDSLASIVKPYHAQRRAEIQAEYEKRVAFNKKRDAEIERQNANTPAAPDWNSAFRAWQKEASRPTYLKCQPANDGMELCSWVKY